MSYVVLIITKDNLWSDGATFATFGKAIRHRQKLAERWSTSATAIHADDGRVLAFRESLEFQELINASKGSTA